MYMELHCNWSSKFDPLEFARLMRLCEASSYSTPTPFNISRKDNKKKNYRLLKTRSAQL